MKTAARQFVRDTLEVIFPRACVACGDKVEEGALRHVCTRCTPELHVVVPPHCSTCGHPYYGEMLANRLCTHCEALMPHFGEGKTAILLKGSGRALVHALKYHHGLHVLEDVVTLMRRAPGYVDFLVGKCIVPVPLHPRKLRERRYNQSLLLAEAAVRATEGRAVVAELLVRSIDTLSQTHFDRETRQQNLRNAFSLAAGVVINPAQHYLLIDDVFTTGSTLNACAAVLRKAGAVNLDVVTFGHG
ncbi:MAG: double zinc ribbon domain-containing protein [Candidatus Didemnitutus sp.]|nr:double zinc ribbon domain-containing protein [Candidatus Didemnitutus sp.]